MLAVVLAWPVAVFAGSDAPVLRWRVTGAYPHDPGAFTQGLLFHDGLLYESTGLRGRSSLRKVEPASGRVLAMRELPPALFGEGLALIGGQLVQLTWTAGLALRWTVDDFRSLPPFEYDGEGWGLAFDGRHLVMSDGSSRLVFRDPHTFAVARAVTVIDGTREVDRLNELEVIEGAIYANVWRSPRIARIDPASGRVTGWLDLSPLPGPMYRADTIDVLNGIAWDEHGRRLLVTGKLWPRLFALEVEGLNMRLPAASATE